MRNVQHATFKNFGQFSLVQFENIARQIEVYARFPQFLLQKQNEITAVRHLKMSRFILALDYNFGTSNTECHKNVFLAQNFALCAVLCAKRESILIFGNVPK